MKLLFRSKLLRSRFDLDLTQFILTSQMIISEYFRINMVNRKKCMPIYTGLVCVLKHIKTQREITCEY